MEKEGCGGTTPRVAGQNEDTALAAEPGPQNAQQVSLLRGTGSERWAWDRNGNPGIGHSLTAAFQEHIVHPPTATSVNLLAKPVCQPRMTRHPGAGAHQSHGASAVQVLGEAPLTVMASSSGTPHPHPHQERFPGLQSLLHTSLWLPLTTASGSPITVWGFPY